MPRLTLSHFVTVLALGLLALLLARCEQEAPTADFVARVEGRYLTQQEVAEALAALPTPDDTLEARKQIVEQWVTNELLYREALRRNLNQDEDVKRMLRESERSVVISALLSRLYEETEVAPSPADLQNYYARHRDQLKLREPFVQVRHLATRTPADADAARRSLQDAVRAGTVDSLWAGIAERFADDPDGSRALAESYVAESRIFGNQPAVRQALTGLNDGQIARVIATDSLHHVLQLVDRVPTGTIPQLAWIEDELVRRVLIQSRKQMYGRQVQRLRNEAMARENLEIR